MIPFEMDDGSRVIVVPMVIPDRVFKILNQISVKTGKTVGALVNDALREKIEKMVEKLSKEGERNGRL